MRLSEETSVCNDSDIHPRMNHLIQSLRSELGKRNKKKYIQTKRPVWKIEEVRKSVY